MKKSVDMRRPPRGLDADGRDVAIGPQVGPTIRTLAASKPGGVIMALGFHHPAATAWLLDGMDITTRLLVLVGDTAQAQAAQAYLTDDIRVAVHAQEPNEFLHDIRSHELRAVLLDTGVMQESVLSAVAGLLEPGGLLIALGAALDDGTERSLEDWFARREEFQSTLIESAPQMLVAARRATVPRTSRRGSRRRGVSQSG